MKQAMIGLAVLVVFVVYAFGVRHEQPTVSKPLAVTTTPAASGSTSGTSSSTSPSQQPTAPATQSSGYKNGTFTGSVEDAFYGNVQVSATVASGKLTNVTFLQYPNTHDTSVMINQQAMPWLTQEAIQKQSANVDIISGATFTSQAFIQSLTNALNQAQSA